MLFLANVFHGVPDRVRLALAVRDILKVGGQLPSSIGMQNRVNKRACWASREDQRPSFG